MEGMGNSGPRHHFPKEDHCILHDSSCRHDSGVARCCFFVGMGTTIPHYCRFFKVVARRRFRWHCRYGI